MYEAILSTRNGPCQKHPPVGHLPFGHLSVGHLRIASKGFFCLLLIEDGGLEQEWKGLLYPYQLQ
jgi:hypothetical protein